MAKQIRNFLIQEPIARGGMATVYKAVQTSLDRVVAVKELHSHLVHDKSFIERFEREAKSAATLKHENIVDIIEYGQEGEEYFLAMEYVPGESLKDLLTKAGIVPIEMALFIAEEVLKGLEHAHARGITHRDIKPANILLSKEGGVKIADFGLAQAADVSTLTVTGALVGTPAYMSPEQAAGRKVDCRSDLFSLGVVLYELLCGEKPFMGETYSAVITRILTGEPQPLGELNPLVTPELWRIAERALAKDPDRRYQSAADMRRDLEIFREGAKMAPSRSHLAHFLEDPRTYGEKVRQRQVKAHFEKGVYYMNLGLGKIDDAIEEFTRVIHLDPDHSEAGRNLAKLRKEREESGIFKVQAPPPAKKALKAEARPKRDTRAWVWAAAFVVLGVLAVAGWWGLPEWLGRKTGQPPPPPSPPPVTFASLELASTPAGAEAFLDDQRVGETPCRAESVALGTHRLLFKKPGYEEVGKTVEVSKPGPMKEEMTLTQAQEKGKGTLLVRSIPPGAHLTLDGRQTSYKTPYTFRDLSAGTHTIGLVLGGYQPVRLSRKVAPDAQAVAEATLVAVVEVQPPTPPPPVSGPAFLKITVNPWAKVYLDDEYIETTPIGRPIQVSPGKHLLKLVNPAFQAWSQKIEFKPGETVTRDVALTPVGTAYLKVTVNPWADVYIDGDLKATTPSGPIKLNSGKHTIKLVNPGFEDYTESIDFPENQTVTRNVDLKPKG